MQKSKKNKIKMNLLRTANRN